MAFSINDTFWHWGSSTYVSYLFIFSKSFDIKSDTFEIKLHLKVRPTKLKKKKRNFEI